MKHHTKIIKWLTYANGDFQCKKNSIDYAVRKTLTAVHNRWYSLVRVLVMA